MITSDPSPQTLEIESGIASYTDEGKGWAVVAIHGLPGSARDFRYLAPALSRALRVIRIEMPGFGDTPLATAPDPTPLGRARYVLDVVGALGLESPLLVGHSMGGVVACAAASLEPDRFCALALLSSPGLREHKKLRQMPVRPMQRILSRRRVGPLLAPLVRRLFALGGFKGYPDHELYRTVECIAATSIAEHAQRVRALALPTLVGWCDDDPLIEAEIGEELAGACPGGPRLRFADGGHNPQKHHAAEIGAAIIDWMQRL